MGELTNQELFWKFILSEVYEDNLIALELYDKSWGIKGIDVVNQIQRRNNKIWIYTYYRLTNQNQVPGVITNGIFIFDLAKEEENEK